MMTHRHLNQDGTRLYSKIVCSVVKFVLEKCISVTLAHGK